MSSSVIPGRKVEIGYGNCSGPRYCGGTLVQEAIRSCFHWFLAIPRRTAGCGRTGADPWADVPVVNLITQSVRQPNERPLVKEGSPQVLTEECHRVAGLRPGAWRAPAGSLSPEAKHPVGAGSQRGPPGLAE
jgi:hypothetical protein